MPYTNTTATRPECRTATTSLVEYFRCSADLPELRVSRALKKPNGYFRYGEDVVCFGQNSAVVSATPTGSLHDVELDITKNGHGPILPFDPVQVINNLR